MFNRLNNYDMQNMSTPLTSPHPTTSPLLPCGRYGALFAAQAWLSAIVMFPLCFVAGVAAVLFDWRRMRPPAAVAQAWGRLVLLTMGCRPRVEGAELLPPPEEPVVFVANHGSYLDIPVTNFLPRLCKVGDEFV